MGSPIPEREVVIIGGGLAGLSLAVRLAERPDAGVRARVLEPRQAYADDRVWCRFDVEPHLFPRAEAQRIGRVRVAAGARSAEIRLPYDYVRLDAAALYADACARIAASAQVRLERGVTVLAVRPEADSVVVETDRGPVRAAFVVDTRPDPALEAPLWQTFQGFRVAVDRPVFDPGCITLMDFAADQTRGVRFIYALAFDRRHALIEDTWFCAADTPTGDAASAIGDWLRDRHGIARFEVTATESGRLPMGAAAMRPTPGRVVRLGLAAGDIRAATGYAYAAIQRRSASLADALIDAVRGGRPTLTADPAFNARTRWMDRVFLRALAQAPREGAGWFLRLFGATEPGALVRFLHDGGRPSDAFRVATALPPTPFARAALGLS